MLRQIFTAGTCALALLAGGALAQTATDATPKPEDQPATETPAEASTDTPAETSTDTAAQEGQPGAGEQQLDLGRPVEAAPQLGERYAKESFGDWTLACIKTEAETDPCSLLQVLRDKQDNAIAEVSLFRIEGGAQAVAGATVIVPLETLLPAQLTIAIDGAPGKRYNYSFCNPIGCVAQIGLTQADIDAFKRGKAAKLSLRPAPAPDQVVEIDMSLSGFTAGYEVVDVVSE